MTVTEIARLEEVSERQIQRYISLGFKGHKLPAAKTRRAFVIDETDYRAWRVDCGFDFLPQPEAPEAPGDADPVPSAPKLGALTEPGEIPPASPREARPYPPYPQAADPHGVPTNVPHEHSSTMPHPLACRDYFEAQARKMKAQLRGYDDDNE
jgi:hypothetical protein